MGKTILITGGAGFIGFNLLKHLLNLQDTSKIIIVDNFITSNRFKLQTFIEYNSLYDKVDVIEKNICDNNFIKYITDMYPQIDEIYHLASIASPKYYTLLPMETLDVGYIGTRNILEIAFYYKEKNIDCKILLASTSEVYGDPAESPQKETYYGNTNSYGQRSCYDESKRIAESLFYIYNRCYLLNTRIARIFNTYGPYMNINDGRIVTETIRCILDDDTLYINELKKDNDYITATRSLCYVDDTVKMLTMLMASEETDPVNIGNDNEISIDKLVTTIKQIYDVNFDEPADLKIVYREIEKDDPKIRKPCLEKNKKILNFNKFTPLQDGILKTIDYFYSN